MKPRFNVLLVLALMGLFPCQPSHLHAQTSTYGQLKPEITAHMGKAQKRLWVITDFLSDADILTSLTLAQYRGLDVKVLVGKAKAQAYMSRVRNLKALHIPVFLTPSSPKAPYPTGILADASLLWIKGSLDFLQKDKEVSVAAVDPKTESSFQEVFMTLMAKADETQSKPTVKELPLVGRPGARPPDGSLGAPYSPPRPGDYPDTYRYQVIPEPPPPNLPTKLPQIPKWQQHDPKGPESAPMDPEGERPPS